MTKTLLPLMLVILLAGCMQTAYRPLTERDDKSAQEPLAREVLYHLDRDYYRDPPTCVFVLPTLGLEHPALARRIADSLAQHLSGRVERVVSPLTRQRIERKRGIDLENSGDRRRFALEQRCPFQARAVLGHAEDAYMLVWSERQVGLRLELARAFDDKILWRAAHTARRGDGGLPLSPLSVVASAATAGAFHADGEIMDSLIDDALRRMLRTLPDSR
ncbi:hypothetical protein [Magnetospira sp. QH-2]|uniref:hypothetical protein n=1 Tax=Magnetospira sp. (strain QH-2) TaxID=1288970 RepID=UPI0003E8154A|nr:hypothetical protein [Magnetospira sp. QH-2]CCQ75287.1 exported protein of unknown function [Magnetospira sp. QH-2]